MKSLDSIQTIDEGRAQALLLLEEIRIIMLKMMALMLKFPALGGDPVLIEFLDLWKVEIKTTMGDENVI
jgi:hypothetical protein